MRTTLVIDDHVYEVVRLRAFQQRRSLGEVVSELALKGLQTEALPTRSRRLGHWTGPIWIADDFDDTPPEVLDALDEPIEPPAS